MAGNMNQMKSFMAGNMGLNTRVHVNVQGRRCYVFIPWIATVCFLAVFIGVVVWAAGAAPAFSHTKTAMNDIGLDDDVTSFSKFHSVGAAAIAVCLIFVCITLGVAMGRAFIEQKFEAKSQRYLGTNVWLAIQATLTVVWWLISLWLVFIVMATCLWWGCTLALKGSFEVAMESNITFYSNTTRGTYDDCPSTCYKPDYFQFITNEIPCICSNAVLEDAYSQITKAKSQLVTAVAGSIIIWIGSSLVVLNMATAFAVTRKEIKMARHLQNLGDEANTVGATSVNAGAFSHQLPKDTMPLLNSESRPPMPFPPMPFPPMPGSMPGSIQMPGLQPPMGAAPNVTPGPRLQINMPPMAPRMPGMPPVAGVSAPPMPPPQYQAAVAQPPPS